MAKKSIEPFLWTLFSGGGVISALFLPAFLIIVGFAIPLGWVEMPSYGSLSDLFRMPLIRLGLFVVCSVPLFHWAHRFRFTLYDGLQIKHLNEVISVMCYGGAVLGTIVAAYVLWNL